MRAVRVHELQGPRALRLDHDVPEPSPGPGEVLVDVAAAGVNFPDVLLSYGKYQFKPTAPFSPGGEVAGTVRAVGDGVSRLRVGDRVAATMISGGFAERVVVPETAAVPVPEGVTMEVAAATLLTYATTLHALEDRAHLARGETLLVLGASGGVGMAAIQLGKHMGARVIAAASTDAKVAACKSAGADEGIVYTREDMKERLKVLTAGGGVDVVYDPVGGAFSEIALRATAWEGRYLVVGFAAGEIPKIPLNLVLLKGCAIVGVFWGAFATKSAEKNRANAVRLFEMVKTGAIAPKVDGVYAFADAGEALARMERREVVGKLVLRP